MKPYSLDFEHGFNALDDCARGDRSHVLVTLENGNTYRIAFWTPYRVQVDLEEYLKLGEPCFGEPGLIIIPEITLEQMQKSIEFLMEQEFFEALRPVRKESAG